LAFYPSLNYFGAGGINFQVHIYSQLDALVLPRRNTGWPTDLKLASYLQEALRLFSARIFARHLNFEGVLSVGFIPWDFHRNCDCASPVDRETSIHRKPIPSPSQEVQLVADHLGCVSQYEPLDFYLFHLTSLQ
jgi:hypothetical protein